MALSINCQLLFFLLLILMKFFLERVLTLLGWKWKQWWTDLVDVVY